jgi:hypothetical protein
LEPLEWLEPFDGLLMESPSPSSRNPSFPVIPAKAGIQEESTAIDHRTVKDPTHLSHTTLAAVSFVRFPPQQGFSWFPAFAGMTD